MLLDRDGTLNVKPAEGDYVTAPERLELLAGAATAVRRLNEAGLPVAVVTNQRGVALGRMSEDNLAAVHARLRELLAASGARVDAIYHCPHERGTCRCRKPRPGLLQAAARDFGIPASEAVMIGDSDGDVEAGRRAGAATVQLTDDPSRSRADRCAATLGEAVEGLLGARDA